MSGKGDKKYRENVQVCRDPIFSLYISLSHSLARSNDPLRAASRWCTATCVSSNLINRPSPRALTRIMQRPMQTARRCALSDRNEADARNITGRNMHRHVPFIWRRIHPVSPIRQWPRVSLIRAHREKLHPGNRGADNTRARALPLPFKPFLSDSSPSCTLDRICNDYGEWTSRRADNLKMLFRCSAHRYRLISTFRSIPARVDLSAKRLLAGLDIL